MRRTPFPIALAFDLALCAQSAARRGPLACFSALATGEGLPCGFQTLKVSDTQIHRLSPFPDDSPIHLCPPNRETHGEGFQSVPKV